MTSLRCSRLGGILALVLGACQPGEPAPAPRPAVILISIDTLRADHLGLYGYERDTSPFLDRFGAESVVFERVFTSAAWTLIAHMTMLTGLYPEQHGVVEPKHALAPEVALLAERMRSAGYTTIGLYRLGWIAARHGFGRGFEVFQDHKTVEEAEQHLFEQLARVAPEQPTFLFLHLFDAHNDPASKDPPSIYSAPAPYQDLFVPGAVARMAQETYKSLKRRKLSAQEQEDLGGLYDDGIRHVDAGLERIFARLAADGRLANALVIITSDHGESLAQRNNWGHGGPWQEGLHVPLIVRLPDGSRAGQRVAEIAHLVDVTPTIMDAIGLPADPLLPGRSLLRPLPADRAVTGGNSPVGFTVRWPEKLICLKEKCSLFDLEADPGELRPRDASAEECRALHAALELAPGSFHAPVAQGEMSPEERDELDDLGYGGNAEDD